MAILDIVIAPAPVLKKKAEPIKEVNDEIRELMDDMLETMYKAPGVGLAGPQVGVSKRVVVLDVSKGKDEPLYMVNPEITYMSEETRIEEEGCLSVPEQFADVERPSAIKVNFLDYNGQKQTIESDEFLATCIQHEVDHLNGVLFIDRISSLRKNIILRKLKKFIF